jgi:hypothetical protein
MGACWDFEENASLGGERIRGVREDVSIFPHSFPKEKNLSKTI